MAPLKEKFKQWLKRKDPPGTSISRDHATPSPTPSQSTAPTTIPFSPTRVVPITTAIGTATTNHQPQPPQIQTSSTITRPIPIQAPPTAPQPPPIQASSTPQPLAIQTPSTSQSPSIQAPSTTPHPPAIQASSPAPQPPSQAPSQPQKDQGDVRSMIWEGTKTILRLVKESADAFAPLKSTAGGLLGLIDLFEVNPSNSASRTSTADFILRIQPQTRRRSRNWKRRSGF
jgi:hypothetical protein